MAHSKYREARWRGYLKRQVELLEAIAEALDADVEDVEMCPRCGEWYKSLGPHKASCNGP